MSDFEFKGGSRRGPVAVKVPGLWVTVFSAGLAAVLVGGLLLGLGVRAYVYWSVRDAVQQKGGVK